MPNSVKPKEECLLSSVKATDVEVNVSAPGKIILHGEHSVVYGKLALAASLGRRTKVKLVEIGAPNLVLISLPVVYFNLPYDLGTLKEYLLNEMLPLNQHPKEFNWELPELIHFDSLVDRAEKFLIHTAGTIPPTNASQRMSLKAMYFLISGILGSVNVDLSSLMLECRTELDIGAGTGSSASFLVSFAAALVQYVKIKSVRSNNFSREAYKPSSWEVDLTRFNEKELDIICKWAYFAEKIIHGTPSGIDNTICTYGSMVEFRKGLSPKLLQTNHPIRILLINTRVSRETKHLVSKVAHLQDKYPDLVGNILQAMEDVAFVALQHVTSLNTSSERGDQNKDAIKEHYVELGRMMSINHDLLSALGVSHVKLEEAMLILSEKGLHGKLTGAGGGGYAISLLPPFVDQKVVEEVMKVLFTRGFDVIQTELGGAGVMVN